MVDKVIIEKVVLSDNTMLTMPSSPTSVLSDNVSLVVNNSPKNVVFSEKITIIDSANVNNSLQHNDITVDDIILIDNIDNTNVRNSQPRNDITGDDIILIDKIDNIDNTNILEDVKKNNNNVVIESVAEYLQNNEVPENQIQERKKRGPPKAVLENAQKYEAMLEKTRMLNKKDKKNKKDKSDVPVIIKQSIPDGMRRVIIAGKPKLIKIVKDNNETESAAKLDRQNKILQSDLQQNVIEPIKLSNNIQESINETTNTSNVLQENTNVLQKNTNVLQENTDETTQSSVLPSIQENKQSQASSSDNISAAKLGRINKSLISGKKSCGKYAMYVSNDIKKHTSKNVRNFKDLRRVDAIETLDLDSDLDTSKASIAELRKLKLEQRKKNAEEKKKLEMIQKESPVQVILKNPLMSKFAKTVAIKNLSVSSRRKKNTYLSNQT